MRFTTSLAATLLGVLLVQPAWAVDMCFQIFTKKMLVVKGYRPPTAGKCRVWAAYEASTSVPHPATATACLNKAQTKLYVHWTWHTQGDIIFANAKHYSARTVLPYPSLSNGDTSMIEFQANTALETSEPTSAFPCSPAPMP